MLMMLASGFAECRGSLKMPNRLGRIATLPLVQRPGDRRLSLKGFRADADDARVGVR